MTEANAGREQPVAEGTVLWEPSADRVSSSNLTAFTRWLARNRGLEFSGYPELWEWSVRELSEFWSCVWDYFEVPSSARGETVLEWPPGRARGGAEGASWFSGSRLNYVDQVLRQPPSSLALVACAEGAEVREQLTYMELTELARRAAEGLSRLGVARGDRVAAVLGNGAHAVVAFLATASLGAVWTSCAPEFGAPSMVDRFRQIEPKVLLAATGYRHRGRFYDLSQKIADLEARLPSLSATVTVAPGSAASTAVGAGVARGSSVSGSRGDLVEEDRGPAARVPTSAPTGAARITWEELIGPSPAAPMLTEQVEFSHPLWILYSSGTTGLPKPIVHGHGGIVLEHLKALSLQSDIGPDDRFFWFTTTGWMMWNFLVGGLLVGATIVCYEGDPLWPDPAALWRLARDLGITYFGTSAPYLEACRRGGVSPRGLGRLRIRSVGSTGAPLSPEGFAWASAEIGDDVLVGSVSGGTDVCTAFLASCPWLEVRAGELQCRALGADVRAYDEEGAPVVGEVGELVVASPMPSMPTALWGDDDGSRLHEAYFSEFSGVWRHGDWIKITPRGSAVVYGRSDATLNRGGVRMGTSEFYRVVEALPGVSDALVVDTSELGREGELLLLVVPAGGAGTMDAKTEDDIRKALREGLSPRHVPDRIVAVPGIPRTINGKKLEVPIRRILLGVPVEEAVASGALDDPTRLDGVLEALSGTGQR